MKFFLNGGELKDGPTRSLLFGEGVFETFRWCGGPPAFLENHFQRMCRGAEVLGIDSPGEAEFIRAVEWAVEASGIKDARVKVCLLSLGPTQFSARASGHRLLVGVSPYRPPKQRMNVHLVSFRRNSTSPLVGIKCISYVENVIGRREAEVRGFDEGIFLNERGEVTEGCTTNIFWVIGKKLFTPATDCGLLPGVTRKALISLAPGLGFEVQEGRYGLRELLESEAVFLTNSLIGVAAVSRVDGTEVSVDEELFGKIKTALYHELRWVGR